MSFIIPVFLNKKVKVAPANNAKDTKIKNFYLRLLRYSRTKILKALDCMF
jgi:hypothetical protein